ncbi:restriction endonuclease subunit S [Geodermatophilus sp. SYSU D01119]
MITKSLEDLLVSAAAGFWGSEPSGGDVDVLVVRNGDIKPGRGVNWAALPQRGFRSSEVAKSRLLAGDLLLTTSGDCGVVAMVEEAPAQITCASNFIRVLRVDPDVVHPKYLFHFMQTAAFRGALQPFIRGTTMKNLSTKQAFPSVHVPLPSVDEQRRIAAVLDQADSLHAKRRQALQCLEELVDATYFEMFGNPVTNDRGWPTDQLGSLATTTSGGTPSRARPENYGGTIPWVKSGELHAGVVFGTEESLTEEGLAGSAAKLMPVGTVLVAMYGATAGAVSVLGIEAATNQAICSVLPGPRLDRRYLVASLRAMNASLLLKRSGGAQPNLSQALLRSLLMPVPPIELQVAFADQVQRIEAVRGIMDLHVLGELFGALRAGAFSSFR